jgi:preprotein translocase subunit YajC
MYRIVLLLAAVSVAFAEATGTDLSSAPAAPAGGGAAPAAAPAQGNPMFMILMMVAVFAFMWFVLIRPQRKEEKRRKEMIDVVKRGDKVITIGGVHGVIDAVGETTVDIRFGGDGDKGGVVVTHNKTAIGTNLSGETAATKGK